MPTDLKNMDVDRQMLVAGLSEVQALYFPEIWAWKLFWEDFLGKFVSVLGVQIPAKPECGAWRLIIMSAGSAEFLFERMRRIDGGFADIETMKLLATVKPFRTAQYIPYATWIPDRSRMTKDEFGSTIITLEECLADELEFNFRTGKKYEGWRPTQTTVCYGSVFPDGRYPEVSRGWSNGLLSINPHLPKELPAETKCKFG